MAQGKWYIIIHRPKTSGKHSQKQTRKKCLPLPLESIKSIVTSRVKTIVTTLPSPQQDPDQNTTKASKPAACTTANHHRHRPKTSGKKKQKQTWKKCLPLPLESIKTIVPTLPAPQHDPDQNTDKASKPAACTTANHHRHRNHWPGKGPNQPPTLEQTTIYAGPKRPENRKFQKCLPSNP